MALSWNEIKDRALHFTKEWEGETRERAEKDTFWNEFFNIFGISRRRLATFEEPVKKLNNKQGFIDLFWKGTLLVEHKSHGRDLDAAFEQAADYFHGIPEHELPKYILVSDFERFRLYDLDEREEHEFTISELHENIKLFGFIAGYQKRKFETEDPVNIKAAETMGKLHDELKDSGYEGHPLELFLVRLLFCLFADDTGIFEKDYFKQFLEEKTSPDGSDLGIWLAQLFQTMDTELDKRMTNLDEQVATFPYVNGNLFAEPLPIASFTSSMRQILLEASGLDWGKISPAIFGSMFQSVMKPEERRNMGAHYTSEKNILKLIKPLFLDELREEFDRIKTNKKKLGEFHKKLASLNFLDPACGCGNFLIITYRELRLLELDVLKAIYGQQVSRLEDIMLVDVGQFYGIEYDEFPARIAEVAMWLMDHQMNLRVSEEFGQYFARLPLRSRATIWNSNALRIDWQEVIPKEKLSFILGNPPFLGYLFQSAEQKKDLEFVFSGVKKVKILDYVCAWYIKSAELIQGTNIKVAFVSTNSIAQGEQVGVLWAQLFNKYKAKIHFAHRTFKWTNEARGKAAVHVIIIGFANFDVPNKIVFEYEDIASEPIEMKVHSISPYLCEGGEIVILSRREPICDVPKMTKGSQPTDNGNLLFNSKEELDEFLQQEPKAKKYIRKYVGARELINNIDRWCLWLVDIQPSELREMKHLMNRINHVREFRSKSTSAATRKYSAHHLFQQIHQPNSNYMVVPSVSSQRRNYIPCAFFDPDVITSNLCLIIPDVSTYHFGMLMSAMHMSWVKYTCGRLKSDYRYSKDIVYNNYPWPKEPTEKQKAKVEEKAQAVLDVREKYMNPAPATPVETQNFVSLQRPEPAPQGSSLADLYDPLTMPPDLVKAHKELDKAVDQCYRKSPFTSETDRIEFLFELYNEYTAPLQLEEKAKKKRRRKS